MSNPKMKVGKLLTAICAKKKCPLCQDVFPNKSKQSKLFHFVSHFDSQFHFLQQIRRPMKPLLRNRSILNMLTKKYYVAHHHNHKTSVKQKLKSPRKCLFSCTKCAFQSNSMKALIGHLQVSCTKVPRTPSPVPDKLISKSSSTDSNVSPKITAALVKKSVTAVNVKGTRKTGRGGKGHANRRAPVIRRQYVQDPLAFFEQLPNPERFYLADYNKMSEYSMKHYIVGTGDDQEEKHTHGQTASSRVQQTQVHETSAGKDMSGKQCNTRAVCSRWYQDLDPYRRDRLGGLSGSSARTKNYVCPHCVLLFESHSVYDLHQRQEHSDEPSAPIVVPARSAGNVPVTFGPRFRYPKFSTVQSTQSSIKCTKCTQSFAHSHDLHAHIWQCARPSQAPRATPRSAASVDAKQSVLISQCKLTENRPKAKVPSSPRKRKITRKKPAPPVTRPNAKSPVKLKSGLSVVGLKPPTVTIPADVTNCRRSRRAPKPKHIFDTEFAY